MAASNDSSLNGLDLHDIGQLSFLLTDEKYNSPNQERYIQFQCSLCSLKCCRPNTNYLLVLVYTLIGGNIIAAINIRETEQ